MKLNKILKINILIITLIINVSIQGQSQLKNIEYSGYYFLFGYGHQELHYQLVINNNSNLKVNLSNFEYDTLLLKFIDNKNNIGLNPNTKTKLTFKFIPHNYKRLEKEQFIKFKQSYLANNKFEKINLLNYYIKEDLCECVKIYNISGSPHIASINNEADFPLINIKSHDSTLYCHINGKECYLDYNTLNLNKHISESIADYSDLIEIIFDSIKYEVWSTEFSEFNVSFSIKNISKNEIKIVFPPIRNGDLEFPSLANCVVKPSELKRIQFNLENSHINDDILETNEELSFSLNDINQKIKMKYKFFFADMIRRLYQK
jgi:hypothetical protein